MTTPLNINVVKRFIRRYTGTSFSNFTDNNLVICKVGLEGVLGNPKNFTDLLAMWKGQDRGNINALGLMRIWAAIYRTYYDWITAVKRIYPNPNSTTLTFRNSLIDPRTYKVSFISSAGVGSIKNTERTGPWMKSDPMEPRAAQTVLGFNEGYGPTNSSPGGFPLYNGDPSPLNDKPELHIEEYYPFAYRVTNKSLEFPFGGGIKLFGGPITCTIEFDQPSNVTKVRIPPPGGIIPYSTHPAPDAPGNFALWYNFVNPEKTGAYFGWFFPTNFRLSTSTDGINFNQTYDYGTILNTLLPESKFTEYPNTTTVRETFYNARQIIRNVRDIIPTDPDTEIPINFEPLNLAYNSSGSTTLFEHVLEGNPTVNNSNYRIIIPKEVSSSMLLNVLHIPTNTVRVCSLTAIVSGMRKAYIASQPAFEISHERYRDNALNALEDLGLLVIKDGATTIFSSNFKLAIWPPKNIKTLQITSGINDGNVLRKYLASFPYIEGTTKTSTVELNPEFFNENYVYIPNFNEPYWTTYSPESFVLNNTTLLDSVSTKAYKLTKFTGNNVEKWKLMPFTLPSSTFALGGELSGDIVTLKDIPEKFNYTEDYIDNSIIPLPLPSQLPALTTAANGLPVHEYYLTNKINELLNELINHVQSTCLKTWKIRQSLSVKNYRDYTSFVILSDNTPLGYQGRIQQYKISLPVDIRSNGAESAMWFLAGGATREDNNVGQSEVLQ